jgi:glycerophosphoryl diester phosphodiesterase
VNGQVPLLIEIKDQDGEMGPDVGPLEKATADALADYTGDVAVMSFNPHSVAAMAQLAPQIPRGITTSSYLPEFWPEVPGDRRDELREIPDYTRTGACFISHEADDLDRRRVSDLKSDGARVLCWTVRSPEAEAKAREVAENVTFEGYRA